MSIDGRITVDALFHDRSGDERLKVLSLASSVGYTTGKAVIVTGTAGTASVTITWGSYRDASGNVVALNDPAAIVFSWSGSSHRTLNDTVNSNFRLKSKDGQAVFALIDPALEPSPQLVSGTGTGTYTIIMWGAD